MGYISRNLPAMPILLMGLENRAQPSRDGRLGTKIYISEEASLFSRGSEAGIGEPLGAKWGESH